MLKDDTEMKLDEELYSRQLYVIGHDAMKQMMKKRILIIGLDGLGQEIAKDLCLAGVKSVSLYDKAPLTPKDLGSGFYFTKESIGCQRDQMAFPSLKALNKYVHVDIKNKIDLTEFEILVSVNQSISFNIKTNTECRKIQVRFIMANVSGLFSHVFTDLITHVVTDKNGEPPSAGTINDIDENGILTLALKAFLTNRRHCKN